VDYFLLSISKDYDGSSCACKLVEPVDFQKPNPRAQAHVRSSIIELVELFSFLGSLLNI
jgi:hypothetical protein